MPFEPGVERDAARRPLVVAHRGASARLEDNSLEAIEAAIVAGAEVVEFDVRRTRDRRMVAVHDARVGGRLVSETDLSSVRSERDTIPPTLGDVCGLCAGRVAVDVELKEPGYVAEALDTVLAHLRPDAVIVTSFLDEVVSEVRARYPGLSAGLLVGSGRIDVERARDRISESGSTLVGLPHRDARRAGLAWVPDAVDVYVWTVNDGRALRYWLCHPRVAGVITDHPARALRLRRA